MKALKLTIGTILLLVPFAAMTGVMLAAGGVTAVVIVWGAVAVIVGCIFGGLRLLESI